MRKGEDMSISCNTYNGQPFDNSNSISTGFFFVASNNKTITFFDKWYGARNDSGLTTEQDALNYFKTEGVFSKLNMKVRYLDTDHFCGFCQTKCNVKKVMTVHANCCGAKQSKISDLTAVLKAWLGSDGRSSAKWPKHKACLDSLQVNNTKNILYILEHTMIQDQHILLQFSAFSSN
jgi:Nucleotide-diphospho-sugar transferase